MSVSDIILYKSLFSYNITEYIYIYIYKHFKRQFSLIVNYCLRSVRIMSFYEPYFYAFVGNTEIYIFHSNAGRDGPEKL